MDQIMFFSYENKTYPSLISQGFHSQYIFPIASKFCRGKGIDIGCAKEEWAFPGAGMCDMSLSSPWNDALNIPVDEWTYDYVFSSHCLEHIPDYFAALSEWTRILRPCGILFLYLPSIECEYWRPANNRKHLHILHKDDIFYDLEKLGYRNIFVSGVDLAFSYSVVAQKKECQLNR